MIFKVLRVSSLWTHHQPDQDTLRDRYSHTNSSWWTICRSIYNRWAWVFCWFLNLTSVMSSVNQRESLLASGSTSALQQLNHTAWLRQIKLNSFSMHLRRFVDALDGLVQCDRTISTVGKILNGSWSSWSSPSGWPTSSWNFQEHYFYEVKMPLGQNSRSGLTVAPKAPASKKHPGSIFFSIDKGHFGSLIVTN